MQVVGECYQEARKEAIHKSQPEVAIQELGIRGWNKRGGGSARGGGAVACTPLSVTEEAVKRRYP